MKMALTDLEVKKAKATGSKNYQTAAACIC
jgi:hypothetical protein